MIPHSNEHYVFNKLLGDLRWTIISWWHGRGLDKRENVMLGGWNDQNEKLLM